MDYEEKWVKHYSSNHRILLVGEGDFSFSSSLALRFGSAFNIVATSLDTYDTLVRKYKKAQWNLEMLMKLGAFTMHGVDATRMKFHPYLNMQKFDRIIFNFPHAGFHGKEDDMHLIERHKKLVLGFFANARGMLRANGEIHVSHKTSFPFSAWNIKELAWKSTLGLIECVEFKTEDYPGYNNKRGDSKRSDEPFPLGECCTYKFGLFPAIRKISNVPMHMEYNPVRYKLPNAFSFETSYQPNLLHHGNVFNGTSEIYETPIRSDLYDIARQRSLIEAYGRHQPTKLQYLLNLVKTYG